MRLAAVYDSLESFILEQPRAWAEAQYAREDRAIAEAFEDGTIANYRDGGKWNVPVGVKPTVDITSPKANLPPEILQYGLRWSRRTLTSVIQEADAFETCDAYVEHLKERGYQLPVEVLTKLREHFATPLTREQVIAKAGMFRTFQQFCDTSPRYAQAAIDMGFAKTLRECTRHLSTVTWALEGGDGENAEA